MNRVKGFTVIELLVAIVVIVIAGTMFFIERNQLNQTTRDTARKVSINAMYYALEEVYYPAHHSYPASIDSKVLRSVDPELFKDPEGNRIGTAKSDFRYTPIGCTTDGACSSYTLQSTMEREATYIKKSRN